MKRRKFIRNISVGGSSLAALPITSHYSYVNNLSISNNAQSEFTAELVVAGGGLGGCATALAGLRNRLRVVMTEETNWLGGQISQQGVPPDEHRWIESHGATQLYRDFRNAVRQYYFQHYPVTETARKEQYFNPGNGAVSRLCHEPRVAVAVLEAMFAPYLSSGQLTLLLNHKIIKAEVEGEQVKALTARNNQSEKEVVLTALYFADATELGDLLPLTNTEYVTGAESKADTKELHAAERADPTNQQSFTMCLAMDYVPGTENLIEKPKDYNFWRNFVPELSPLWPGELLSLTYTHPSTLKPKTLGFHPEGSPTGDVLNLWNYRKLIDRKNFKDGTYPGDSTIINWPQNDYFLGNLVDVSPEEFDRHVNQSKQLSLSLFYWLQTEAPRPDGGQGWPGLRLRGDILGTEDGLAKYPYVRESRRIKPVFRVLEEHVGKKNRMMVAGPEEGKTSADFYDSVGIGYYHIDLHPSSGGDNYIDFASLPFQIPLGSLLPQQMQNLLPANKNIGTTHITNGCYRLHPVEWSIGEAVGMLAAFALNKKTTPHAVRESKNLLADFQQFIRSRGIETHWPD